MTIRSNKARADRLVQEVQAERRARREHLERARRIFERRLASPGGLAVCFGAGAVAGLRLGRRSRARDNGTERADGDDEQGFFARLLDSPVGSIAVRLATATLVRSILTSPAPGAGEETAGGEAGSAATEMAGDGASY